MADHLTPPGYMPRVADGEVERSLRASSAVVIEGPRACGKTWTGRRFARSEVPFDAVFENRLAAQVSPRELLEGPVPRLLDEWQLAPDVWNAMRRACDDRAEKGQFILTGSADPPDDATRHAGAGRIIRVRMRPVTLFESGESSGSIPLSGLLASERSSAPASDLRLPDIVDLACRGGWPGLLRDSPAVAQRQLRGYLDEISRTDISRVDGIVRDPAGVRRLLASLGRNTATDVAFKTLGENAGGNGGTLHTETVKSHLAALARLFVVEELRAWKPHLRSRAELRLRPKRCFVDPSLAVAALRSNSEQLMRDLSFFGRVLRRHSGRPHHRPRSLIGRAHHTVPTTVTASPAARKHTARSERRTGHVFGGQFREGAPVVDHARRRLVVRRWRGPTGQPVQLGTDLPARLGLA